MKITIIGAGIIGVSSAYFLAKSGYEVEVIDRQDGPGLETSFANAGMLTPSMSDPWNSPGIMGTLISSLIGGHSSIILSPKILPSIVGWGLSFLNQSRQKYFYNNLHRSAELCCYSMKVLAKLNDDLDINYQGYKTGSMKIFRDQSAMDKLAKLSEQLKDHGMTYQVLKSKELLKLEPSLKGAEHRLCGGVYFPDDQAGNAYQFTCEMEVKARNLGVSFHYGVSVNKMIREGEKITKIITSEGEVNSNMFILCTGSYSMPLARTASLNIPVRPAKGYSLTIPINGWKSGPRMPLIDDGSHLAITPLGDTIRIAGAAEFSGYDRQIKKNRIGKLYDLLDEIYPQFSPYLERDKVKEWSGLRPLTPDGSPYIGRTPIKNLYLNTGHGPLGWTMAAGSAKMLSNIIDGKKTILNENNYCLNRH